MAGFSIEQSLALAVILQGIEDLFIDPDPAQVGDGRDEAEIERDRESARIFFHGDKGDSLYSLYADILDVPMLAPDAIADNLRASNRKMVGAVKKSAMVNIIGPF